MYLVFLFITMSLACIYFINKHFSRMLTVNPLWFFIYSIFITNLVQAIGFILYDDVIIDLTYVPAYFDVMPYSAFFSLLFYILLSLFIYVFFTKLLNPKLVSNGFNFYSNDIQVKRSGLIIASMLFFTIVTYGMIKMASVSGFSLTEMLLLSSKHLEVSDYGPARIISNGQFRVLTGFAIPVFLLVIAYYLYKSVIPNKLEITLLVFLFLLAAIPMYVFSARGGLVYLIFSMFLMLIMLNKINLRFLILGFLVTFVFLSLMTANRYGVDLIDEPLIVVKAIMLYGGGNSLFNNAVVFNYIQNNGDIFYGSSYIGALLFFVPRFIYPDKPLISFDEYIATSVYGLNTSGLQAIPAGMYNELLLNFGLFGIVLGLIFYTFLIVFVIYFFLSFKNGFLRFALMTIIFPKFMLKLIGSGLGFALMETILLLIPLLVSYYLIFKLPPLRFFHAK